MLYAVGTVATGRALRPASLRDHRGRAHRQHRVIVAASGDLPADARDAIRTSTSRWPRSSCWRSAARSASSGSWRCRPFALDEVRVPTAGHAGHRRPQAPTAAVALGVGRAPARRGAAPHHRARHGQPGGGRGGRLPVLLRRVPRALRDPGAAGAHDHPPGAVARRRPRRHGVVRGPAPLGPRRHGDAPASRCRRRSWRWPSPPCACCRWATAEAVSTCSRPRSHRSAWGCSPTEPSSCWRVRSTRSATAGRRRSSQQGARSSAPR